MKETLVTISKRTGFAISTVSRVLNNQAEKYRISKKTVELIMEEARRCNYTPSLLAKGLRLKRTNTLGLLIPSVSNPYFADIASVIIQEAKSHGYTVMVVDTMENELNEQEGIRTMLARLVDGIIAVPCGSDPAYLEQVNRSVPVILIDRYFERTTLPYVSTDNYRGGVDATRLLQDNGHRNILCIQGVPHSMPNRRRVQGYLDTLERDGLRETAVVRGDAFSIENGYTETRRVLGNIGSDTEVGGIRLAEVSGTRQAPQVDANRPETSNSAEYSGALSGADRSPVSNNATRPTALFALSNTILLGAVKAIREMGLRIPEDISVVSFDNNPYLDFLSPAITRISQPLEDLGKTSVKLLLESIREGFRSKAQIQLAAKIILGSSVKKI